LSKDSQKDIFELEKRGSTPSVSSSTATAAALLGADLVVVALSWDNPPTEGGIVTITFLMLISFIAFIHVLHQTMRSEFLTSRFTLKEKGDKAIEEDYIEFSHIIRSIRIMHLTGLLFTMIAFWVISYKYLISSEGYQLVILILPFILFLLYWIPKMMGTEREVTFRSRESLAQLFIQIIFLVLICLDFFRIISIP
jgi:hypothetical protein